ncbi:hypothetical protein G5I_08949 [Acromyrmex echinatior]|uniref:Uncharacterized protein n=1 Tax=Acromyrmex echinatior TaxID=103372 RepID=F4WSW2_ACREC|nr:hypothetical protein G5I_08949 [Acromyrmex echinatior]
MLIAMAARVRRGRHFQDPNCPEVEPLDGATSSGTSIVGGGGPLKAVGVKLALPTMTSPLREEEERRREESVYPSVRKEEVKGRCPVLASVWLSLPRGKNTDRALFYKGGYSDYSESDTSDSMCESNRPSGKTPRPDLSLRAISTFQIAGLYVNTGSCLSYSQVLCDSSGKTVMHLKGG